MQTLKIKHQQYLFDPNESAELSLTLCWFILYGTVWVNMHLKICSCKNISSSSYWS